MMSKKILALSSIRSDYDLMSGLYSMLNKDSDIDLRLLVSGAHLSKTYGLSVSSIRSDGLKILAELETLIDGDTPSSRLKTASIMLQGAIDTVRQWAPDLIIYAGDREDVLIGAMIGAYLGIPTVHFFGGDHEEDGHVDTLVRHATSKLSTAHVVSINEHRDRLIAMGESAHRIFVTGSVALDKFIEYSRGSGISVKNILPKDKKLDGYALLIFHPVDSERNDAGNHFENILQALADQGVPACVSYPNTDPGNHAIIEVIKKYEASPNFWFYKNLEREKFLSLYKSAQFLIGNSSSGILEAASIPLGVINVGRRQKGRYCGENIIFCSGEKHEIGEAIKSVRDPKFHLIVSTSINPYGDGKSCVKAYTFLKDTNFQSLFEKYEDPLDLKIHNVL